MIKRNLPLMITIGVFVLGYFYCLTQFPGFASTRVICNILTDNAFLGIIAVGMTFVILSGGIDDYQKVLDDTMAVADILTSMVVDVSDLLDQARQRGDFVMFEGAQGTLLDIDHGTYPYVTSSNTTAGGVATGSGLGPRYVDYVLGILKAYSTRVGAGPFPTELFDETGEFLCKQGNEFGATTGRRRRTGWLDTVAVRRAVQLNSLSGFCLTKLDVLDGLKEVKLCRQI